MLSLFECIKRSLSVSLKDIKLIANVNIEFSMYQIYLRLFMTSFKYGLISLRYSLIDISIAISFVFNVIVAIKITSWFQFVIIVFFHKVKKVSNICDCSDFNYFVVFFNLKIFLTSLIMLASISVSFSNFLFAFIL